jgi:uncharacterized protein (TIGR00288 family)
MSIEELQEARIALLIDCDNANAKAIEGILGELAKYGVTNIRRAYGDWKSPHLNRWEDKLHEFAIKPIQQFSYTRGKNATDIAMIIDAMDLLYSHKLDAFALVTSDSDFTPLVMRILTQGLKVYGFGEQKTPNPFVKACSRFIYTENLEVSELPDTPEQEDVLKNKKTRKELRGDTALVKLLRQAVDETSEEDGSSNLSKVGHYISNNSSFSPLNYGYKKLIDLLKASELFEIKRQGSIYYLKDPRKMNGQ